MTIAIHKLVQLFIYPSHCVAAIQTENIQEKLIHRVCVWCLSLGPVSSNRFDWIVNVFLSVWFLFHHSFCLSLPFALCYIRCDARRYSVRSEEPRSALEGEHYLDGKSHLTFTFNSKAVGNWEVSGWTRKCETFFFSFVPNFFSAREKCEKCRPDNCFAHFFLFSLSHSLTKVYFQ